MRVPKAICAITPICDSESTRYALGGVLFGRSNKKPVAVATDGRRLVHATWDEGLLDEFKDEPPPAPSRENMIVSGKTVKELASLCNGSKGANKKRFFLDEAAPAMRASFTEIGIVRVVETELIEGRFPNWQGTLATKDPLASVNVSGELALSTLKAVVSALECEGSMSVRLDVIPDKDGKPTMLRITGEHDGRSVTGILMGVDKQDC
jgi:hypothetical protein